MKVKEEILKIFDTDIFKTINQTSVIGNLYGRMFALLEMEKYIITEKNKVQEQLNEERKETE